MMSSDKKLILNLQIIEGMEKVVRKINVQDQDKANSLLNSWNP